MHRDTLASTLEEVINSCHRCVFVDKPFVRYCIYRRFLPEKVRTLVVSESPPPGTKPDHLYNLSTRDRLRRFLARVLKLQSDTEVVKYLLSKGIFWTNAVKCRPVTRRYIEHMRRNCLHVLKLEIEMLRPAKIVAAGVVAQRSIRELGVNSSFKVCEIYHPLYISRFRKDLEKVFVNALEDP